MGTLIKIVWPHIFLGGIAFWAVRTQWFWTWTLVTENRFLTGALAILRGSAPKVLDIGGIHTLDYPLVIKHRNGQSTICSWFSQSTSIFIGGFQTNHFWYHGCSRLMVGGEPKGQFLQKKTQTLKPKNTMVFPKTFFFLWWRMLRSSCAILEIPTVRLDLRSPLSMMWGCQRWEPYPPPNNRVVAARHPSGLMIFSFGDSACYLYILGTIHELGIRFRKRVEGQRV